MAYQQAAIRTFAYDTTICKQGYFIECLLSLTCFIISKLQMRIMCLKALPML